VVLIVSAFLIVLGAALIAALDANGALEHLGAGDRVVNALFSSVSTRTAGFNTVDFGAMRAGTLLIVIVLMFIGGSPASCAGGIKTTTAAVVFAALRGELRGREPHLAGRALSPDAVRRATAVLTMSMLIVVGFLLVLTLTEPDKTFLQLAFETVSAFGTVGLSTGITPSLSIAGKIVISLLMFVGRVGPLTIALAVGRPAAAARHRLAREDLPIG
jgi:trk system potassium uptake protein TrkH